MKLIQDFIKKHSKSSVAQISTGDVVRVHETIKEGKKERIQIFEGIVISKKGGQGLDGTFTVRKVSFGVGVEKIYPLHMPTIIKIEVVKKIKNKQSKLYYLRHLTDKQIQKRSELSKYSSWEDETDKQEEEALKKKNEEEEKKKDDMWDQYSAAKPPLTEEQKKEDLEDIREKEIPTPIPPQPAPVEDIPTIDTQVNVPPSPPVDIPEPEIPEAGDLEKIFQQIQQTQQAEGTPEQSVVKE